jgi:TolB protein
MTKFLDVILVQTGIWKKEKYQMMIGYSEFRTNLSGGLTANRYTTRAYIVNLDGTGRCAVAMELTEKPYTWTQFAGWSPDGSTAIIGCGWEDPENAIWEEEHQGFRLTQGYRYDMYLLEMATDKLTNVTAIERVSDYNAGLWFWPNDPSKLGFNPIINGIAKPFIMDIDGRNKKDLSSGSEGFTYGYSASPNGKKISYHKDYQVYIADTDGSNIKHIETDNPFNFAPQWSPDGDMLLFVSGEHYNCHPYIVQSDGSGLRKLADRRGYSGVMTTIDVYNFHGGSSDVPIWSRDGKWVYYTSKFNESIEFMRVDLNEDIEQLTYSETGIFNYHPTPSPDGKLWIIGSTRDGVRRLYVMKGDGNDIYPITNVPQGYATMHPHWNPKC